MIGKRSFYLNVYLFKTQISDSHLIANLCGTNLSQTSYQSTGNVMSIHFKTDYSVTGPGFSMSYTG